jgi:hypothetical protein
VAHSPELGPFFPTVCTAARKKTVESSPVECKARSQVVLMRLCKEPALHNALNRSYGVFSGAFSHSSWWRSSENSNPVTWPSGPFSKVRRVLLPLG